MTISTSQDSPLAQAVPESLNEIFNKDPELASDEEVARVVKALRQDRERFIQTEKAAKAPKIAKAKADPNLSLEDLDL